MLPIVRTIPAARALRPGFPPPVSGNPALELRRAGSAAARMLIRRRSNFHGWLQTVLLRKHELTSCGCGLITCR